MTDGEAGFSPGVEVKPVRPGVQAILRHGDGTATAFWGPTRDGAKARLKRGAVDVE